jgi:hypothetical protein
VVRAAVGDDAADDVADAAEPDAAQLRIDEGDGNRSAARRAQMLVRELENLLRAGKVRVDRIKCADWPDMIATARKLAPVYVHFPLDAGTTSGRAPNFADADRMARQSDTPYVNLHLVTWQRDLEGTPAVGELAFHGQQVESPAVSCLGFR